MLDPFVTVNGHEILYLSEIGFEGLGNNEREETVNNQALIINKETMLAYEPVLRP